MVQPNPPRFLREGDVIEFTVKVTNQSAARQTGHKCKLTLHDALDDQAQRMPALGNTDDRTGLRHSVQRVAHASRGA